MEQAAFGTGVLVDGLDFSDDKMLQGRTFSYSDTQRHRVGTNYLQLPINRPRVPVHTNQRDGAMAPSVDLAPGGNPHVNYFPSVQGGLQDASHAGTPHTPYVSGNLVRQVISRENNFQQAGERYRAFADWERDDLINNLVDTLKPARKDIQEKMISLFSQCDADYGKRVAEGLAKANAMSTNGAAHATGAGEGAPNGADPDAVNKASRSASEIGHPARL